MITFNTITHTVVDGVDYRVRELDRKWGIGRLRLLVDDALRVRFDRQRQLFDAALVNDNEEQVAVHGAAMRRGWDALDAAATAAGAEPKVDLTSAIAECLSLHAEAVNKLGTEFPEQHPDIPAELKIKMSQARINVSATLEGSDPTQHVLHLQALNKGLRIILRQLIPPAAPEPPAPPQPVWNDNVKRWQVPATDAKTRIAELAKHFDEQGPDDPNELFRDGGRT